MGVATEDLINTVLAYIVKSNSFRALPPITAPMLPMYDINSLIEATKTYNYTAQLRKQAALNNVSSFHLEGLVKTYIFISP